MIAWILSATRTIRLSPKTTAEWRADEDTRRHVREDARRLANVYGEPVTIESDSSGWLAVVGPTVMS